ncbi:integrase catalytic domain-containing protein [Trichonephila clavipes]|nr:integrase catalytic domain-containing protein [Trichonephila clavipes]
MFRQILVNGDDVEFQRIFWREIPEESLKEYRLLTVTYGTACAPYLSIRTIQQLAEEEIKKFPEASKVALEDFYVDDLITGTNSKEDAKKLVSQVIELMKKGGFPIRKWASNESSVLESLPTELRSSSGSLHIEEDHLMKILGIIWNSKEDTFRINISPPNEVRPTKRQLLSTIAKIYDPLGFLSPTTIQLKILMQDIWKENISWDDPVTDCIFESWTQFKNQMKHLAEIQIPRYLAEDATAKRVLLIGFCDASQRAYAAVFYLRTELVTGKVHVSMITSKTRVAPVKSITLPRLELLAALLLSELYVVVLESLRKQMENLCCQSYLKNSKMTSEASWHHVKSQENPADCASRGIAASKLKVHKLWWSGPQWLSQDSLHFPSIDLSTSCEEDVKCEEKSSTVLTNVSTSSQGSYLLEIIAKYSSFSRLIRVIAWCKRYIKNCRLSRVTGVLTSKEVDDATKIVIQTVQESQFHSEIQLLNKKHPLPNSSKLLPLSIFLDTDGIIKVGGRLKNSSLSPIQKHPILLPKSHHLTNLVIQHFHHINLHSGPQLTLCCIRQKFWIPSGRGVVGRLLSKCQTCLRFKAKSGEQLMGNLPANRLSAGRAFLNVGIDFGGPFITKPNVSRSKVKLKSYLALFICMATKAVHLEVVSDLSADAFWQHSGASYPDEENQPTCFPTMQLTSKEPLHI